MKKSKFFVVATEGATTDGRTISREWIEKMAANYNPKTYGARVNLEHLRGVLPDGPFRAYGDVLALKSEERDGKLQLLAQISPTDDLVTLNKARQKVYTSMEVDPDFADTSEPYMVGLAVTDSPASLGTEMLQFSANAQHNPLAERKQKPDNLFSEAVEADLEFSDEATTTKEAPKLLEKVTQLFQRHAKALDADQAAFRTDLEKTLELIADQFNQLQGSTATADALTELQQKHNALQEAFNQLHQQLDSEPAPGTQRAPATGGGDAPQTDC